MPSNVRSTLPAPMVSGSFPGVQTPPSSPVRILPPPPPRNLLAHVGPPPRLRRQTASAGHPRLRLSPMGLEMLARYGFVSGSPRFYETVVLPPAAPLVGIEPNPGPVPSSSQPEPTIGDADYQLHVPGILPGTVSGELNAAMFRDAEAREEQRRLDAVSTRGLTTPQLSALGAAKFYAAHGVEHASQKLELTLALEAQRNKQARFAKNKRLVGVELNPGPKSKASKAAKAIVQIVAGKSRTQAGQRLARSLTSSSSSSRSSQMAIGMAPVSYGTTPRNSAGQRGMSVPFSTSDVFVRTDANSVPYLYTGDPNSDPLTKSSQLDLSPQNAWGNKQTDVLGLAISNLAKAYAEYQCSALSVAYSPAVATSQNGELIVGYVSDPASSIGSTFADIASLIPKFQTNAWRPASFRVDKSTLNNSWHYTFAVDNTAAEQRQVFFGSLAASGFNLPASTILGCLQVSGVINFRDLCNRKNLALIGSADPSTPNLGSGVISINGGCTAAAPFGATTYTSVGTPPPFGLTATTMVFPSAKDTGQYLFSFLWHKSTANVTSDATLAVIAGATVGAPAPGRPNTGNSNLTASITIAAANDGVTAGGNAALAGASLIVTWVRLS